MFQRAVTAETVAEWLARATTDLPVQVFAPAALEERHAAFRAGFPGEVTYAVKANPADHVIALLHAGGMNAFDVASPEEMALVARTAPGARLNYHNPVRSRAEIAAGVAAGALSWSVDDAGELEKLLAADLPDDAEIAVRIALPVKGAAYDFGAKFGAEPGLAARLMSRAAAAGRRVALTFHVGTQCAAPSAWTAYLEAGAKAAAAAKVQLVRVNVGGGFPGARDGLGADHSAIFAAIREGQALFPRVPFVCEPGRGLVADAFAHAVKVKSVRDGAVYLNDGIYGALSEFPSMGVPAFTVHGAGGIERRGVSVPRTVWGPTCDSLDRLPGRVMLPSDIAEDDWILFGSMGAYSDGVGTRFNGYGRWDEVTVSRL